MSEPSPYGGSYEDFRRRTPRVYGVPAGPGEEPEPATATATVEALEPRPNPNTIEGAIAGIGAVAAAAVSDDPILRRRTRPLVVIARVACLVVLAGVLFALLR